MYINMYPNLSTKSVLVLVGKSEGGDWKFKLRSLK